MNTLRELDYMQLAQRIDLDIFCLLILVLILVSQRVRGERRFLSHRLFLAMVLTTMLLLLTDAATWCLDGRPGAGPALALTITYVIYFSVHGVAPYLWFLYSHVQIFQDEDRTRRLLLPTAPLMVACALLAFATPFTGMLFYVDAAGFYHRGPWIYPFIAANYVYLVAAFVLAHLHRKRIERRSLLPLLAFPLPPGIGGAFQMAFQGVSLIWPGATLSLLSVYITIQHDWANTDYLTGVYNRMQADRYLRQRVAAARTRGAFAGAMVDIDNFKEINDRFGHAAGDRALEAVAELLRKTVRRGDFVARFGGDEFLIILRLQTRADLDRSVARIREAVREYSDSHRQPFALSLSVGCDVYDPARGMTDIEFLAHVDALMYRDKTAKRLVH